MNKMNYFFLIFPETHEHLGLFQDLVTNPNVEMRVAKQKNPKENWGR